MKTTGSAGFRLDAIKHMDRQFVLEFVRSLCLISQHLEVILLFQIQRVRETNNRQDLFVVAEFWSSKYGFT